MPVVLAVAALLVAPPALGVLGTSLADVPYIGLATAYVPWYLPWLTVASVVGGVLAMIHWGLRRGRIAAVLAVEHAGADISLIDTFGLGAPKQAAPDDEATYATFEESRCGCASTARDARRRPTPPTSAIFRQRRPSSRISRA